MPTLGEFIRIAKNAPHNLSLKHTPMLGEGPRGPVRFYYLQREAGSFVVLPDLHQERRLERATVENWCKTLGLPGEDFGVGPVP